jgi:uncharacterized protein YggU (UPF0235/DUF167 family)
VTFWALRDGDVLLAIRLTPGSSLDRLDGPKTLSDGKTVLAARVRAIPEDGAANEALCRLIAKAAGVPKSRVDLVSGQASRLKTVKVAGDATAIVAALSALTRKAALDER